ncbi:hypothetical protein RMATCC62417_08094 [Rhizopus microsporus]|nr:hypothetical protein RMATCC62417_08094 [Rhizopus microsporus]
MDKECPHCHALHWIDERQETSSLSNPSWESCCKRGSVQLQLLPGPPQYLKDLQASTGTQGRHFKDNLRQYNAAFAFTSLGCDIVSAEDCANNNNSNNNNNRSGLNAFQIHGALCHRQGPLTPIKGSEPSYPQLYIFDPSYAAERRQARNNNLDPEIIRELSAMLAQCNPSARVYRHAHEVLSNYENINTVSDGNNQREDSAPYIIISPSMRMCLIEGSDRCTHNLPTMEEISAVIPIEYNDKGFRDIVLTLRSNSNLCQNIEFEQHFQRISQAHAAYMPTHYVLLFPHGTYGWHWGLQLSLPTTNISLSSSSFTTTTTVEDHLPIGERDRLSQRAYYRFRLHLIGEHEFPAIFYAKRIFQQFLVDAWAICDQNKLDWIRQKQDKLRTDVSNGLADAIAEGDQVNAANLGRRFILPSGFHGDSPFIAQLYYDSMAIVRHFGKPSLFITFTANPKWAEITNKLLFGQVVFDRPDLIARVFSLKVHHLLKDLKKKNIFGRYKGLVRTIECKKRSLPHMHLLLFLGPADNFTDAEKINQIICAEIPDKTKDSELFEIVTSCMLHGPCGEINPGSPCMVQSAQGLMVSSKRFPKPF